MLKNQVIFSRKKASSRNLSQLPPNNSEQISWTKVNISGCFSLFTTNPKLKMTSTIEKKWEGKLSTTSLKRSFLRKITESRTFWRPGWIICFIFQIWQLRPILKISNRQLSTTSRRFNKRKKSFSLMISSIVQLSKGSNKILRLIKRQQVDSSQTSLVRSWLRHSKIQMWRWRCPKSRQKEGKLSWARPCLRNQ